MIQFCVSTVLFASLHLGRSSFPFATCPSGCSCVESTRYVVCRKLGWTELPRNFARGAKVVDLSGNQINLVTSMNLERAGLQEVIKLNLSDNEIEKVVDGAFAMTSSLQSLDLSWNNLTELGENAFHSCRYLKSIDISHNNLKFIDGVFQGLRDLSRLDLQHNRISSLTQLTFKDLTNLTYLNLASNKIFQIDRKSFKTLEKLMFLFLRENPILNLVRLQFNSYFLSNVDFSSCNLRQIPKGLPSSIKYLQLGRNNLTILEKTSFQDCPYISILILDDSTIAEVEEGSFSKMVYLQQLWLNYNLLAKVPHKFPDSLESLSLESNKIQHLDSNDIPSNSKLAFLMLSGNVIRELESGFFSKLKELLHLDLSDNRISRISSGTFEMNGKLKVLVLSRNPLLSIDPGGFRGLFQLSKLFLAYIQTPMVLASDDCFEDMRNLTSLTVDESPAIIRTIVNSEHHLKQLSSLKRLSIANSQLSSLRSDFPNFFPNLEFFQLTSSRWFCDESILWLREAFTSGVIDLRTAEANRCYAPTHLKGKTVVSLRDESLWNFAQRNADSNRWQTSTSATYTFKQRTFLSSWQEVKDSLSDDDSDEFVRFLNRKLPSLYSQGDHTNIEDKYLTNVNVYPSDLKSKSHSDALPLKPGEKDHFYEVQPTATSSNKKDLARLGMPQRKHKSQASISHKIAKNATHRLPRTEEPVPSYQFSLIDSFTIASSKPSRFSLDSSKDRHRFDSTYFLCGAIIMVFILVFLGLGLTLYCFFSNSDRKQNTSSQHRTSLPSFIVRRFFKLRKSAGMKKENCESMQLNPYQEEALNLQVPPTSEASIALIPARDIHHEGPKRVYTWTDF